MSAILKMASHHWYLYFKSMTKVSIKVNDPFPIPKNAFNAKFVVPLCTSRSNHWKQVLLYIYCTLNLKRINFMMYSSGNILINVVLNYLMCVINHSILRLEIKCTWYVKNPVSGAKYYINPNNRKLLHIDMFGMLYDYKKSLRFITVTHISGTCFIVLRGDEFNFLACNLVILRIANQIDGWTGVKLYVFHRIWSFRDLRTN